MRGDGARRGARLAAASSGNSRGAPATQTPAAAPGPWLVPRRARARVFRRQHPAPAAPRGAAAASSAALRRGGSRTRGVSRGLGANPGAKSQPRGLQGRGRGVPPPSAKRPALAPPSAPPCGTRKPSRVTARAARASSQLAAAVSAAPPPGARRRGATAVARAGRVRQVLSRASAPARTLGCGAARRQVLRSLSPTPGRRGQRWACAPRCAAPGHAVRARQASTGVCGGRVPTGSSRRAPRSPSGVGDSPHCSAAKAPSCARVAASGGHTQRRRDPGTLMPGPGGPAGAAAGGAARRRACGIEGSPTAPGAGLRGPPRTCRRAWDGSRCCRSARRAGRGSWRAAARAEPAARSRDQHPGKASPAAAQAAARPAGPRAHPTDSSKPRGRFPGRAGACDAARAGVSRLHLQYANPAPRRAPLQSACTRACSRSSTSSCGPTWPPAAAPSEAKARRNCSSSTGNCGKKVESNITPRGAPPRRRPCAARPARRRPRRGTRFRSGPPADRQPVIGPHVPFSTPTTSAPRDETRVLRNCTRSATCTRHDAPPHARRRRPQRPNHTLITARRARLRPRAPRPPAPAAAARSAWR